MVKGFIFSLTSSSLLMLLLSAGSLTAASKTILFMGDSITAGYGIGEDRAFPALIQEKLDEAGFDYTVMNAGVSGDTSAGGLARINWLLKRPVDIFVLELGANDGLRGHPVSSTHKNLTAIFEKVKAKYPDAQLVLAGMQVPPNLGPDYSNAFRSTFETVSEETNAHLIPFILEGVGGVPELNLPDGIHPTPEGHAIIADLVWEHLEPLLKQ